MIATLQALLAHAGIWALVAIFFVIMLESSAFLGLLFPGEMAALIAGALFVVDEVITLRLGIGGGARPAV